MLFLLLSFGENKAGLSPNEQTFAEAEQLLTRQSRTGLSRALLTYFYIQNTASLKSGYNIWAAFLFHRNMEYAL